MDIGIETMIALICLCCLYCYVGIYFFFIKYIVQ
jgi:hypothetical protein